MLRSPKEIVTASNRSSSKGSAQPSASINSTAATFFRASSSICGTKSTPTGRNSRTPSLSASLRRVHCRVSSAITSPVPVATSSVSRRSETSLRSASRAKTVRTNRRRHLFASPKDRRLLRKSYFGAISPNIVWTRRADLSTVVSRALIKRRLSCR